MILLRRPNEHDHTEDTELVQRLSIFTLPHGS